MEEIDGDGVAALDACIKGKTDRTTEKIIIAIALIMACLDGMLAFMFPVLFPIFEDKFKCNLEQLGRIQLVYYFCQMLFCFFSAWLANKIGYIKLIAGALLFSASGLAIIGAASNYGMLLAGVAVLGLSETVFFVTGNAIISNYLKRNQSTLFFVFGVMLSTGSVSVSLTLGKWMDFSVAYGKYWGAGVWALAAFLLMVLVFILSVRKIAAPIEAVNFKAGFKITAEFGKVLANRRIWGVSFALMLYCIAYIGILSWIGTLYQKNFGISAGQASGITSLYLFGFLAGRIVFYLITKKIGMKPLILILICAAGSTITIALSITAKNILLGKAMIFISGLFLSAIVPAISSAVGDIFEKGNSFAAYDINMMVFSASYGAGPYIIGFIGSRLSLETSIWTAPAFSLLLCLIAAAIILSGPLTRGISRGLHP